MATQLFTRSLLSRPHQALASLLSRSLSSLSLPSVVPRSQPSLSLLLLHRLRPLSAASSELRFRLAASSAARSFSTRSTSSSLNDPNPNWSNRPPKETILLDGCDFEHWLVVLEKPEGDPTRDEIIDMYIKTLAKVVGSEEEARMKIYSVSTRCYYAFGALVSEEDSYKLKELERVRWVLPDSYLDVKNKDYGGEPFINGEAVPYDPKYHEEWIRNNARANDRNRRNDRPRNSDRSRNFDRRRDNSSFQNPPPPPNQGVTPPPPNQGGPTNQSFPGEPPRQGFQGPPPNQGYNSPPQNQGYNGPPPNQGYNGPPPNQGYNGPPPNQGYNGPPPNQGYNGPPPNQGYNSPPPNQGYNSPPPNQFYNGPPPNQGYHSPPPNQGYNSPPPNQSYPGGPPNQAYQRGPPNQGYPGGPPNPNYQRGNVPPPPPPPGNPGWNNNSQQNIQDKGFTASRDPETAPAANTSY